MQVETPERIRNLALVGHSDTGKTTLASALLHAAGVVNRMNRVEDGHTTTDFDPEEVERGHSIGLSVCYVPWQGNKINLIDVPGSGIFGVESRSGLRAADAGLMVVNAAAGVQVTTEKSWSFAEEIALPVLFHLSKMDRENTNFAGAVEGLQQSFGRLVVPIHYPIGAELGFEGVVDLVEQRAYRYTRDGDGKTEPVEIPSEVAEAAEEARQQLVEAVAETEDGLMETYFEDGDLPLEDLKRGLRAAVGSRRLFPVTLGAAGHGIGPTALLDALVDLAPSPVDRGTFPATDLGEQAIEVKTDPGEPLAALVFKTLNDPFTGKISVARVVSGELSGESSVWNTRAEENEKTGHAMILQGKQTSQVPKLICGDIGGLAKLKHTHSGDSLCAKERPVRLGWIAIRPPAISYAIEPKSKGDEEKIGDALSRLMEEDLGLHAGRDPQTGEFLLSGSGQLHVEIAISKLKRRSNVEVILHPPKVPYRETIKKPADGHGRHKKQTGGRGQFADCKIRIEPLKSGEDFDFVDEIFGGAIPQGYRPAVQKGIQEARQRGYLAGFPVVDFRVRLQDGQYHDVDSSEMAFKIAGSLAFKDAMARAAATLLEPMMQVEITTTDEFTGDIMSDLSQRRGRPQGMEAGNGNQVIKAVAPMAEMLDFAPSLRSITQGRASFQMEFSHYEEVPKQIREKIVAEVKAAEEDS